MVVFILAGGSLFLYDRSQTKKFKDDGINWLKKKGQNRVMHNEYFAVVVNEWSFAS